jgi:phage shock protein A
MSIFTRFKAIFQARVNEVAEAFEDSRASLDYSLAKLEETHAQIGRSLVEVSAAKNRLEIQRDQLSALLQKYTDQAQSAVKEGRDDLARVTLERQQDAQARMAELSKHLDNLKTQAENLKQSEINLEHKVTLFRDKKEELKTVDDSSRAQPQLREALSGVSTDLADVGNTIQRAEARIREMQSRSDAIEKLISEGVLTNALDPEVDEVDRELSRIHRKQAVDDELARFKTGTGG